tara:strand:+ start:25 stop:441 length:417 start_codon:yes stop_codon:yes gene_type:complete
MIKDMKLIKEHLDNCVEIELPYPLEKNILVKYITLIDGEQSFYKGGRYVRMLNNKILLSNSGKSWAVPTVIKDKKGNIIYSSRFFVDKDFENKDDKDIKELKSIINSQQDVIKKLSHQVKAKSEDNSKLLMIIQKLRR